VPFQQNPRIERISDIRLVLFHTTSQLFARMRESRPILCIPRMQLFLLFSLLLTIPVTNAFQSSSHPSLRVQGVEKSAISYGNTHPRYSRNYLPVSHKQNILSGQMNEDNDRNSNEDFPALIFSSPSRTLSFSVVMAFCGATLGPFLDSFHSAFGVLQYDEPITVTLWGSASNPALITAWWVPLLFGVAGWLIGWLYIVLDAVAGNNTHPNPTKPSSPKILLGISLFTFQYWLSGVLVATELVDRTSILNIMSLYAAVGFVALDGSLAGFITSAATGIGGPLIEVGLLSMSKSGFMPGGYHYNDTGETGFFPLWILPVYFLGGPAVGNLARGFWTALTTESTQVETTSMKPLGKPGCKVCNDTRCVACPNCDGVGQYVVMGGSSVKCTSCSGRGFVICRNCFSEYDEDPNNIEAIREIMRRMPD